MRFWKVSPLILGLLLAAFAASGSDVYVVRYDTTGSPVLAEAPCTYLVYRDNLVFRNTGTEDVSVGLLGVSNGSATSPLPLVVGPGRTVSSQGHDSAPATWAPADQPLLWVAHLDVPDDVQLVSRLLVLATKSNSCGVGFPGDSEQHTYSSIAMPVVRTLTPPNTEEVHLSTELGGDSVGSTDGRTNVGVYNGGTESAHAAVELRRSCDDFVLEARTATIPPNTVVQLNNFSEVFDGCTEFGTAAFETYIAVTVDQPSFSYAITLSNQRPPWIPVSSSP